MKTGRRLLIAAAAFLVAAALAFVVVLSSAFQTWAVRTWLGRHPDWHLTIQRVDAGWQRAHLQGVAFTTDRVHARAPEIDAEVEVVGLLLHRRLDISTVVARGWTCELIRHPSAAPASSTAASAAATSDAPPASGLSSAELRGILAELRLPLPTTIGSMDADGTVHVGSATAKLHLTGGGFGAGHTGTLRYTLDAERKGVGPAVLHANGSGAATMGSDCDFTQLQLQFDATASGGNLSQPVAARAQIEITRTGNVERYTVALSGKRPLINATAELAEDARTLRGNWALDVTDADVAPFALGRPLPTFSASGSGQFDADTALTTSHANGTITVAIDRLEVLARSLNEVGPLKVTIDTDIAQRGATISVARLNANIAVNTATVASIRALQAFAFEPRTRALEASDANAPLLGVTVDGLPLRWTKPFLPAAIAIDGGSLRGELTATPRSAGLSFASRGPLTVSHLSVWRAKQLLLRDVETSATLAGDYMPQGWQVECRDWSMRAGGASALMGNARIGRLAGADQMLKATGRLALDFAAWRGQPVAEAIGAIQRGTGVVDFAAAVGTTADLQATLELKNLATSSGDQALPNVKGTIRAAVDARRKLTVNAPFEFERAGRLSDLTVAGSSAVNVPLDFDARLTSANLVLADVQPLLAIFVRPNEPSTNGGVIVSPQIAGTATLDLKHVVASSAVDLTNVTGTIRFGSGAVTFDNVRGATHGEGEMTVVAAIRPGANGSVGLQADVAGTDVNVAPWFRAADPRQLPTVEGRFTITSKLTAQSRSLAALSGATLGEVQCTSKGGVFRGLAVNVGNLVENSSKLSAWLAAAGDAIKSPFIGRKDQDEITSRAQAANELARLFSNIEYDQLAVVVLREESDVARVKEFSLISPELRIHGAGVARTERGGSLLRPLVDLDLTLRARGRTAELMKYLGILENKTDDLGYAACTIPIRVEGALDRPDTTQLSNRLVALAVEKTGLTEKAVDWINRLRGKSAN